MKLLCLDPTGTKGVLQSNAIYTVDTVSPGFYRLIGVPGLFKESRFKVMEEPVSRHLDNHNAQ